MQSNQEGPHPRLPGLLRRHLSSRWREPPAAHNAPALAALAQRLERDRRPLLLDSFCGTGASTRTLARAHPECLVVGIDKSAARLGRHGPRDGDYLLLQADCEAVWRYLAERYLAERYLAERYLAERHLAERSHAEPSHAAGRLAGHYLLYPNPWPKAAQLGRRVHGHPAFPLLLALGGRIELRSNWRLYVEEFGIALHLAGVHAAIAALPPGPPLSPFEAKYRASGHALWRCQARLPPL